MRTSLALLASLVAFSCAEKQVAAPEPADAGLDAPDAAAGDAAVDAGRPGPYTIDAFDRVRINSHSDQPNFQKAETSIELRDGPFSRVTLVVDLATTCYPFETWQANPPPTGQNWPADCDAFDRNFELHLDPAVNAGDPPGIELVRAITPFGGPMHLEVDVTDVANARPGVHRVRVAITTWSDAAGKVSGSNGGWNVTAKLEVEPGTPPRKVLAVLPLWDGNLEDAAGPAPITFSVPEGTTSTRLEYRVTGHGGGAVDTNCIGPAEEFCMREHKLSLDGVQFDAMWPWREDCDRGCTLATYAPWKLEYCRENPCGDKGSVRAPRANWCPGSVTPPYTWDLPGLRVAGPHSLSWTLSRIASGGSWRTSVVLFAFGD